MEKRQKKEAPEHPGVNDNLASSTERPVRRKKPLDVHGIGPSNAKNATKGNFTTNL